MSYNRLQEADLGEYTIMLVCLSYRLGLDPNEPLGVEARVMGFKPRENFYGPYGHRMLEYATMRIVR